MIPIIRFMTIPFLCVRRFASPRKKEVSIDSRPMPYADSAELMGTGDSGFGIRDQELLIPDPGSRIPDP
jgi:hypothetical protein